MGKGLIGGTMGFDVCTQISDFTAVFTWITVTFWTGAPGVGGEPPLPLICWLLNLLGGIFGALLSMVPLMAVSETSGGGGGNCRRVTEAAWSHRAPCCHQPAPPFSYNKELLMWCLLGFTVISQPRYVKKLPKPTVCLFCTSHTMLLVWSSPLPPWKLLLILIPLLLGTLQFQVTQQ